MNMEEKKRIKILLAKSDQDAHDRGIRYMAEILQDAGMEVVFIRYRICDQVARVMEMGVSGVFGPDTPTEEVIQCITA